MLIFFSSKRLDHPHGDDLRISVWLFLNPGLDQGLFPWYDSLLGHGIKILSVIDKYTLVSDAFNLFL